jgi:preprotein translocase subunit SecG
MVGQTLTATAGAATSSALGFPDYFIGFVICLILAIAFCITAVVLGVMLYLSEERRADLHKQNLNIEKRAAQDLKYIDEQYKKAVAEIVQEAKAREKDTSRSRYGRGY